MVWVNADRAGDPARRAVRAVRHRAVAGVRRHAVRQPRPRRHRHPRRVHGACRSPTLSTSTRWSRSSSCCPVRSWSASCCSGWCSTASSASIPRSRSSRRSVLGVIIQNALLEKYTADTRGSMSASSRPPRSRSTTRSHRVAAADHVAVRGRRARRPGTVHQAHQARPRVPGDVRRPRRSTADGHRHPSRLRRRHGVGGRHGRAGRRAARRAVSFDPFSGPENADLRVRSGDHRRPRLVVGHARRRRSRSASRS